MTINIGDKVRFLNDVGGGVVVKMISKTQVMVKDNDDFEYPFPINELVVVEKSTQITNEQKPKPDIKTSNVIINSVDQSEKPIIKNDNITELVLAFVNKSENDNSQFECYLINDSDYYIFYHVVIRGETGYVKLDAEVIEPNTKILLGNIDREQINSSKELIVQMLFYNHPYQTVHEMIERKIKIVPLKFFQSHNFVENDYFDEEAYIFVLLKEMPGLGNSIKDDDDFERLIIEKETIEEDPSKRFKPRREARTIEVDLHINQLVDSVIGMSNAEIIQKQMDVFHKTMTEAITTKVGKVILIHGIGNGTLKEKLRESLTHQYKMAFEDASFREYGFGATLVIL